MERRPGFLGLKSIIFLTGEQERQLSEEIHAGQIAFGMLQQFSRSPSPDIGKYEGTAFMKYSPVRKMPAGVRGDGIMEDLVEMVERGQRALTRLVEGNLGLASTVSSEYHHPSLEREDFQSIALEGLMQAAASFKPNQGEFSVYAARRIREFVKRNLDIISEAARLESEIEGRSLLDSGSLLEARGSTDATGFVERKMLLEELEKVLNQLDDREKCLVWHRYFRSLSHSKVADVLGLPRSEEFLLHGQIMSKIKKLLSPEEDT